MSERERLIDEIAERVWRRLYPRGEEPAEGAQPQFGVREQVEELLQFSHDRQCVMEPGKPCIHSGRCRELGP